MVKIHNNVCRYCIKKCIYGYINKCDGCGSVCCSSCKMIKKDFITKTIYYTYSWEQDVSDNCHNLCMKSCMYSLYNNYPNCHLRSANRDFSEDWTIKYIKNTLGQHLIKDITNIVIEYL